MPTKPTVFIVDDDEAVRDSLKMMLESTGLAVEIFGTAEEFLASYDRSTTGCLLSDVNLPDMSGLELQQKLAHEGGNLPVIIMTGYGDIPIAVKAMKAGAVEFIEKPFKRDVVVSIIQEALKHAKQPSELPSANEELTARISLLTPREQEVLEQLVIGHPNKIIAYELGISPRTVEVYRARVMKKMAAGSLSQLIRMALEAGINPESS